jgi:poly-gamma-glutamate capsule biosynthesis protein CapA/YwtB (metallophosphatase superfamily)
MVSLACLALLSAARADDRPQGSPTSKSGLIGFSRSCAPGQRLTVAAVGDLLFHRELEEEALTPTGSYRQFWQPVAQVLAKADLVYGNLEGTVADGVTEGGEIVKDPGRTWNNRVYTAPPLVLSYNYHPSLIDDLLASGFNVVSTANNHAFDRGIIGIDRTVDNLDNHGLAFSGTRRRDQLTRPYSVITKTHGMSVAWLACTFDTNGNHDTFGQVLYCFGERDQVLGEIKRLASDPGIDAVILTPHWGIEGSPGVERRQRDLAHDAIEAGATAVIGTHPHVQGPWEKITTSNGREGLVVYSTGNFVSNQRRTEQRIGEIVLFELVKEPVAAKARVSAASYVLTWVDISSVHRVIEAPKTVLPHVLPAANRVAIAELPNLTRDCGSGETVTASWGNKDHVEVRQLAISGEPASAWQELTARQRTVDSAAAQRGVWAYRSRLTPLPQRNSGKDSVMGSSEPIGVAPDLTTGPGSGLSGGQSPIGVTQLRLFASPFWQTRH